MAVAVLLGIAIYLTGSRAGIIIMLISFFVFAQMSFYVTQSTQVRKRVKYILLAITLVVVFMGWQNTYKRFMNTNFENAARFQRWPNTMRMVTDFPVFGTGFGTYRYAYFLYDTSEEGWSTHAHNDLLETISDGGLIGALLLLFILGLFIFSLLRMWEQRHHPQVKMIGIGIFTGLFAAFFHSLLDFSLRIPANVLIFVLLLVLGVKMAKYKKELE